MVASQPRLRSFFPIRNSTTDYTTANHPFLAGDTTHQANTPNWYFYWYQTDAAYGTPGPADNPATTHLYESLNDTGRTRFYTNAANAALNRWLARACDYAPQSTANSTWGNARGIDLFANILRHEDQHRLDMSDASNWGNTNQTTTDDGDNDCLRYNSANGITFETDINPPVPPHNILNRYSPTNGTTFTDTTYNYAALGSPLGDAEDYALGREASWTNGTANYQDWATPGMRHATSDDSSD
jgi:hypothetical protein